MHSRRDSVALLLSAALALTLGSCSRSEPLLDVAPDSGAPMPEPSPVVEVTMTEYSFDYPRPVPAGHVVFRVRNSGRAPHHLALLHLPEDFPPIEEQVRGSERRPVSTFAAIYDRRPGDFGSFAVDLVEGQRYGMVCFTGDPDGQSHVVKGMVSEFRAGAIAVPPES